MPPKFTANPKLPSRYRAGKPTQPESSSESDGDSDAERQPQKSSKPPESAAARKPTGAGRIISTGLAKPKAPPTKAAFSQVDAAARARAEAERKAREEEFVTESEESGSEESDDEDSGEESSSEDEQPRRKLMMRPKFVPKSQRAAAGDAAGAGVDAKSEEEEAAARQAALDAAIEEQVRKDAEAKAAGRKHWEDDSDAEPGSDFVDDTDDIDPEAEYAAWKLRELKRIKREREAIEEREREVEEKERRMALTEEERQAEDEARIAKQREEQASRGKMGYLQKYYHKGAFFADETAREGLDKRDLAGVRFQDDVRNRELLPQALQMRDMTKLGRKGATKYKDLKSEDTGRWGDGPQKDRYGRGFGDRFDGDERFRPDSDRRDGGYGPDGAKGANAIPLGERKDDPRKDRGRGRDADRRRYGSRSRSTSPRRHPPEYGRERRTSRSPRRERRDYSRERRKRSTSRGDSNQYHSDKRRRVDDR